MDYGKMEEGAKVFPKRADFQHFFAQRHSAEDIDEAVYEKRRLEAGQAGEDFVRHYLEKYGQPHWTILSNVWLDFYGAFECDVLLLTRTSMYVFEVKNYAGHFVYEQGVCTLNTKKLANNPITQATRAFLNMKNIQLENGLQNPVHGALIFAGADNSLELKTKVPTIEVIARNQLRHFIQEIARKEARGGKPFRRENFLKSLYVYRIENPFLPEPVSDKLSNTLRGGICCAHCESFEVRMERKYVKCACGFFEFRERAICRTICEWGVLHYDRPLQTGKLLEFFDGQISRGSLVRLLRKYFDAVDKNRYSYYLNKKLPLSQLEDTFEFSEPNCYFSKKENAWYYE